MIINVGDILKYYNNKNNNGIAIVLRKDGDMFDVLWLQANGFEINASTSNGYQESLMSQSIGWRKLS